MLRTAVTLLVFAGLWLLLSGHFEPLPLASGGVSVVLTVWLARRMGVLDFEGQPVEMALHLVGFVAWTVWLVILANLQVAKVILSPALRIHPHLIRIRPNQRTHLGRVIHANAITITPGTISLDVRDDLILVHALTDDAADEDSSGRLDRAVTRLERWAPEDVEGRAA